MSIVINEDKHLTADYIIFKDSNKIYAKNGKTGNIDYYGSDATTVIQNAIDSLGNSGGGKIFIKKGNYEVTGLDLKGYDYLTLEGEGYSSGLFLHPTDTVSTLLNFSDYSTYTKILNLRLSANKRNYKIIDSFGKAIYLEVRGCYFTDMADAIGVAIGRDGKAIFTNNLIFSSNSSKTTGDLVDFYPLYGVFANNIIMITAGSTSGMLAPTYTNHLVISNNVFLNTTANVLNGIFNEINLGSVSDIVIANNVLENCHLVVRSVSGNANTGDRINIINNTIKGNGNLDLRILSAVSGDVGKIKNIIVAYNQIENGALQIQGMENVKVINNFLGGGVTLTSPNSNIEFYGNTGYKTENSGTETFSGDGTTTQFTIPHNLASTPNLVNVTANSTDAAGDFYVTADATNIYVNYKVAPPSGTNNVVLYWSAKV